MAKDNKVKIFKLSEILSKLDNINSYFLTLLISNSTAIGLIRLKRGEKDNQQPHATDELYYVIEGRGLIEIDGKDHVIEQGTFILVPANIKHRFHDNKNLLIVIYMFFDN
jgi:mannose-6-phosphate isomerase-like protein (cupin superfamily)